MGPCEYLSRNQGTGIREYRLYHTSFITLEFPIIKDASFEFPAIPTPNDNRLLNELFTFTMRS